MDNKIGFYYLNNKISVIFIAWIYIEMYMEEWL